ncbi:helix-turn-helix transcriptional regulator [Pseudomonas fluvialis]|uniref:Helix-turn-helix transcriptional regulator n=1 Tax=Pseudomonas fluvialis TaxID=1793966 RepID=A0A2I0CLZ9_9PSED|nr:LuxR C-terminal-related transcriptional regulator [Pseudomonas pharmacofabricae]PKF70161.1 helix-turn-helix transcriptional regulator [Pseudomonas pharmacofabricae]
MNDGLAGSSVMIETASSFYRPPLPPGYLSRPQLCQRLHAGLTGRLLLISAPAGFGKSSLAIECCETLPAPWHSLWLGLSARDADPGRFLERLLLGLREQRAGFGEEALVQLRLRQRHQPFAFEQWLGELLDEWQALPQASAPLLLVLDDYHLAQGEVLDRCLQFLLNHLPQGLLLLVTSRQRPDWHLARLRLARQLLELQEQDLRLSDAEMLDLARAQGAGLPAELLSALLARSEGWVAGLRLWLLAAQESAEPALLERGLQGDQGLIRDYLLEEVIERQSAEVQGFLLRTAFLERFCAELCDALRDAHDSQPIIAQLQANQVFLVPLDEQGRWFRYHHLFSDLLRNRLEQAGEPLAGLHLRACRWFSGQGLLDEAIDQALRAGHPEVAASLVQNLSEEQLLAEQNVGQLLRWKMDLPDSLLASTPRLIILYGWALALACQLDAAEELSDCLARFLPARDGASQQGLLQQWLALSGFIARGRGDTRRAEAYCSEALASGGHEQAGQRLLCLSTLANLAVARGDLWRARGLNRDALELAQRMGNPLFEALAYYDRARVLQARGEVRRALAEIHAGQALLADLPAQRHYAIRARLALYQGYLLTLQGDWQTGEACFAAGIHEARQCRDISLLLGYCVLARSAGWRQDFNAAFAQLAEAERLMHSWDVPPVYYLAMITLVKCELWLAQGQLEMAAAWLARLALTYSGEEAAAAPEFHPQLPLHIQLYQARLAHLQGDDAQAERRLRGLIGQAQSQGGQLLALIAQTRLFSLLQGAGRSVEAQQVLGDALQVAEGGALMPLLELLQRQPETWRGALQACAPGPLRDQLLGYLPVLSSPLPVTPGNLTEPLSGRESDVLRLIAQGYSNQQISERLFISLHTVKTHARHINSKLGVERRTQAVARAKELGLL